MSQKYMIHLTSQKNWKEIIESRRIIPHSRPNPFKIANNSENMSDLYKGYIVGIPEESIDAWNSSGLVPDLMKHTKGEVFLRMPIDCEAYVRDHVHISPKRFIEKYGENIFKNGIREDSRVKGAFIEYLESAIPFCEYDGGYEVPEIWLPTSVSIDNITHIETPVFITT